MTDIVERLRGNYDYTQPECYAWHKEAADEIELLRGALKYNEAEIERLRASAKAWELIAKAPADWKELPERKP